MNPPGAGDRPREAWARTTLVRVAAPLWFTVLSAALVATVIRGRPLFFDADLYLEATRTWLAGGDPWSTQVGGIYFAAPPPSLLPFAPFALLPPSIGTMSVALAVLVGAVASVRMLRLPWWWLLFPPLVECVLSANVQGLLIPLILGRAGALAAFLKLYALVPLVLLGRWRAVATTAVALVVTIPVLPWSTFLADVGDITSRLADQTNYALPTIWLVLLAPLAVAALIVVGRERAAWLAVPAIWPSPQYYYASLVMGTGSVIAASVAAIPAPGSGLLASLVLALVVILERRRAHASTVPASAGPSGR